MHRAEEWLQVRQKITFPPRIHRLVHWTPERLLQHEVHEVSPGHPWGSFHFPDESKYTCKVHIIYSIVTYIGVFNGVYKYIVTYSNYSMHRWSGYVYFMLRMTYDTKSDWSVVDQTHFVAYLSHYTIFQQHPVPHKSWLHLIVIHSRFWVIWKGAPISVCWIFCLHLPWTYSDWNTRPG